MVLTKKIKCKLMAVTLMHEIERAKQECSIGYNSILTRVALAVVFIYLIALAQVAMGDIGPIVIAVLFLVLMLLPVLRSTTHRFPDRRHISPVIRQIVRTHFTEQRRKIDRDT